MRPLTFAAILALAACAPTSQRLATRAPSNSFADNDDEEEEEELVCKDERMTGTNMTKVVCRTPEEIATERRAAQEWEKHPRNDTGEHKRR
ncbi:MAG TPA: hypothetical protein VK607_01655 [Kofleriaceae bacterium]|nr:hypothetical protein [Kofleriaceae bacterium]